VAHLSEGRVGRALAYIADEDVRRQRAEQLEAMKALLAAGLIERFARAEEMSRGRESLPEILAILHIWLSWWRDLWLVQQGLADRLVNLDREGELRQFGAQVAPAQVTDMLRILPRGIAYIGQNVNLRLVLEWLMIHLPAVNRTM